MRLAARLAIEAADDARDGHSRKADYHGDYRDASHRHSSYSPGAAGTGSDHSGNGPTAD